MTLSSDLRTRIIEYVQNFVGLRKNAIESAARIFTVAKSTIHSLLHRISYGLPLRPDRIRGDKEEYTVSSEHLTWLVWWLSYANNNELFLDELADDIHSQFGIYYTIRQLSTALNSKRARITRKTLEQIASERDPVERAWYRELISSIPAYCRVYVDESHVDENDARRKKGRGPVNQRAFIRRPSVLGHGIACSSVCSMSLDGILTCDCRDQIIDGEAFLDILQTKILPIMNPFPQPRSVLIMDNASPHMVASIMALIDAIRPGVLLFFLSPFSYDYNPIEVGFELGKARLQRIHKKRFGDITPFLPLCKKFEIAMLECMTPSQACNLFRHCEVIVTEEEEIWANR